jgi:hypothetical protein
MDIIIYCFAGIFGAFIQLYYKRVTGTCNNSFYFAKFQEIFSTHVFEHFMGLHLFGGSINRDMFDTWISCGINNFKYTCVKKKYIVIFVYSAHVDEYAP